MPAVKSTGTKRGSAVPYAVPAVFFALLAVVAFVWGNAAKNEVNQLRTREAALADERDRLRAEYARYKAGVEAERARAEAEMEKKNRKLTSANFHERIKEVNPEYPGNGAFVEDGGGIVEINLRNQRIIDLSPLKGLPIRKLNLNSNHFISDFEALRGMPLVDLDLNGCRGLSKLDMLADSKRLASLSLGGCPVDSLAPLRGQPLNRLVLSDTRVEDISPLEKLPLEYLYLHKSPIRDFSPLAGMPLTQLFLYEVNVSDLGFVRGMPLINLQLGGGRGVTDIGPLVDLDRKGAALKYLGLGGTGVSDIAVLKGMSLERLNVDNSNVTDISPLAGMKTLKNLSIKGLELASRAPLESLRLDKLEE